MGVRSAYVLDISHQLNFGHLGNTTAMTNGVYTSAYSRTAYR